MQLVKSRVADARTIALVILALSTPSGVAGAAPALSGQSIHLEIGQAADLDAEVYFNVEACTKKPHCFVVHEFFDVVFNGGEECGEQSAPVPLAVAECTFHVDNGRDLGPFEAGKGVFVAPATGLLSCGSPETLSAPWVDAAESWAEDKGYRCGDTGVPVPMYTGHIELNPRSQ